MTRAFIALFALTLGAFAAPVANAGGPAAAAEVAKLAETPIDKVEGMIASKTGHIYDANGAETRSAHGVIEGAVLLDSYNKYDVSALPKAKDASLVFYCANTQCSASDGAANRAMEAGYTDVSVMREGIMGWAKAGKKTLKSEG